MINKRILISLTVLQLLHKESSAQEKCNCNPVGVFPATINGITITEKSSGDVTKYSVLKHCNVTAGPVWLGQMRAFSQTITFSKPVNNVQYVINESDLVESFTFTVNNGILTATQGCSSCPYVQSGNTFATIDPTKTSWTASDYIRSAGIITLSSTLPYTTITVNGPGGQGGSLMSICINSISAENKSSTRYTCGNRACRLCYPVTTLACNEITGETTSFSSTSSKLKNDKKNDELTGKWTGSNMKGTKSELEIVQEGNKIKGFESIRFSDGSEALYSISGKTNGTQVEWTEDDPFPFEANLVSNIILCKTQNTFSMIQKNEKMYLVGSHVSIDKKPECNGVIGDYCYVKLPTNSVKNSTSKTLKPAKERKIVPIDNLKLSEKEFTIVIWDNNTEDGDIVTLFLNGEPILENYRLQNAPKEIAMVCSDGENELIMQAESMGTSPPNTAAIKIQCQGKLVKRLIMKSTDKMSQSLILKTNE